MENIMITFEIPCDMLNHICINWLNLFENDMKEMKEIGEYMPIEKFQSRNLVKNIFDMTEDFKYDPDKMFKIDFELYNKLKNR